MLRRNVGWVRFDDKARQFTGQRMKRRLEAALAQHPIEDWSVRRNGQRNSSKTDLSHNGVLYRMLSDHAGRATAGDLFRGGPTGPAPVYEAFLVKVSTNEV